MNRKFATNVVYNEVLNEMPYHLYNTFNINVPYFLFYSQNIQPKIPRVTITLFWSLEYNTGPRSEPTYEHLVQNSIEEVSNKNAESMGTLPAPCNRTGPLV